MDCAVGDLLREARRKRQVTQRELARRVGTTQAAISLWERGERSPTVEQLNKLLGALGFELDLKARPTDGRKSGATGFGTVVGDRRKMQPDERRRTG